MVVITIVALISRALLVLRLMHIIYFVLMTPIPQQNSFVEKLNYKASSAITTSAAWAPFQTACCLIFQLNGNKANLLQSGYTNYSVPVARKREQRQGEGTRGKMH